MNGAGKYYVDYDTGIIWVYNATMGVCSCTPNYKKLDKTTANWRGWGIVSYGGTSYNTALFNYCDFLYMGTVNSGVTVNGQSRRAPISLDGHQSAGKAGDSTRLCYVTNCTFTYCVRWIQTQCLDGTSGDPILVAGNTFKDASGGSLLPSHIQMPGGPGTNYVTFDWNTFRTRDSAFDLSPAYINASTGVLGDNNTGLKITNNTGMAGLTFVKSLNAFPTPADQDASWGAKPVAAGLYIAGNDISGCGFANLDGRLLTGIGGTASSPALVENNHFHHGTRLGHLESSYVTFQKNLFGMTYHHGFTGASLDDRYVTDVTFRNNLFYCDRSAVGTSSTSACFSLGYNHRIVSNNYKIANNTVDGSVNGIVDFNDIGDSGGPTLATNIAIVNNIVANSGYAISAYTSASMPCRLHVLECDYNNTYNQATAYAKSGATGLVNPTNPTSFYQGGYKYNRLASGSRNIPGVALFDASYTTAQSGRSLVYTVGTLGQDHTLTWGAGSAVQLVYDFGTSSGQGLRTVPCTGKTSWPTNINLIKQNWLWVVSGTGAGQARAITWATANTAYAATVVAGGSGYSGRPVRQGERWHDRIPRVCRAGEGNGRVERSRDGRPGYLRRDVLGRPVERGVDKPAHRQQRCEHDPQPVVGAGPAPGARPRDRAGLDERVRYRQRLRAARRRRRWDGPGGPLPARPHQLAVGDPDPDHDPNRFQHHGRSRPVAGRKPELLRIRALECGDRLPMD